MKLYEISNFKNKIICFNGTLIRLMENGEWRTLADTLDYTDIVGANFYKDGWTEYVEPKPKKKYTMYRHCYLFKGKLKCMYDDKPWQKDKEEKSGVTYLKSTIIEEFEVEE